MDRSFQGQKVLLLSYLIMILGIVPKCYADQFTMKRFSDLYSEQTGLMSAKTIATFSQIRAGWSPWQTVEAYVVGRIGADSRTMLEQGNFVYNDNYAFLGLGLDYLGLFPGVRVIGQLGVSQDLSAKINRGGLDGRAGFMTFHSFRLQKESRLYSEIYSDHLFIKRYQNILSSVQVRIFHEGFGFGKFRAEPMFNWVTALDSEGYDFNRFVEARLGFRLSFRGPLDLMLIPYFAFGGRYQMPTDYPTYRDFRVLLILSKNF